MKSFTKCAATLLAIALATSLVACSDSSNKNTADNESQNEVSTEAVQDTQAVQDESTTGGTRELNKGTIDENGRYENTDLYFSYLPPEGFLFANEEELAAYNKQMGYTGVVGKSGLKVTVEPHGTYADMYAADPEELGNNISLVVMNISDVDVDMNDPSFLAEMVDGFSGNLEDQGITKYDISETTVEAGDLVFPSLIIEYDDEDTTRYLQRFYYTVDDQWLVNVTVFAESQSALDAMLTGSAS